MSHLNDGHVGCWERLIREDVKPQPEGEIMEEYKRFLKCMEANHQIAHSPDLINHPPHYTQGEAKCVCGRTIECLDITRHLSFNLGNAVKYIWRCDLKGNSTEDLKKAVFYLNDEIQKRGG